MVPSDADLAVFEQHRTHLLSHAYRMLGDMGHAEDIVQDSWIRWSGRQADVRNPRAFLLQTVTRLCLNELSSARARLEEARQDRLPEPVSSSHTGLNGFDRLEDVSMAFLVVLQRLTPAERAVLLLREIFDFEFDEIAAQVDRTPAACRKLLERARRHVAEERRLFRASRDEHARLLEAFHAAAAAGDLERIVSLLSADAVLVTDGGPAGRRVGPIGNLRKPLVGGRRIATFIARTSGTVALTVDVRHVNGRPALVFLHAGAIFGALQIAASDGRIQRLYFHADLDRLGRV
jgi:RNA polymerase sigma-70 factor (ECF subfamily)